MSAAVVKLPTAAPRKVDNSRWAQQRKAGIALRKEQAVFDYFPFHDREAVIKAERLADFMEANLPLTGEMAVVLGLVQILSPEQVEPLCKHVLASKDGMTMIELARADVTTKYLLWTVLQRRGLV